MSKSMWVRSTLALALTIATFITSSMVVLATPGQNIGKLTVSAATTASEVPFATLDGNRVYTGRDIASANEIKTTAVSGASIDLGKIGQIQLAPNTTLNNLTFDEKNISGVLTSGRVQVSNAADVTVSIKTKEAAVNNHEKQSSIFAVEATETLTSVSTTEGSAILSGNNQIFNVAAGETAAIGQDDDDDDEGIFEGRGAIAAFIAILIGAGVIIVYAAFGSGDDDIINTTPIVVSPVR